MSDTSTIPKLKLEPKEEAKPSEKLMWEKELLGLYISGHPLDKFKEKLAKREADIKKLKETMTDGAQIMVVGIIEEVKELLTKKGDRMMFIKIADYSGNIEAVVFPKVFTEFSNILLPETCVVAKGKFSMRNGTPSVIIEKLKKLE